MAKKTSTRKKQDYQDRYIIRMQGGKAGLVEATSKMDIHEFRVFTTMLTMVLPDDEDFVEYEIRTQDIIKLFSLSDDGRYYEAIRGASERLFNRKFVIFEKKEDGEIYRTTIHLIDETSEPVNISQQNRIRLKFNPKLKPYLLQLQKEYLTIDVRNIANIQSPNSVKLYLILRHQYNLGNRKVRYTVTRLREILAIEAKEYPLYGNFKQKIIQKGIKDLEKYTDLLVSSLEEEKAGRAVEAVVFYLEEKKTIRQEVMARKITRQVIKSSNGKIVVSSHTPEEYEIAEISEEVIPPSVEVVNDTSTLELLYEKVKKYKVTKTTLKNWLKELPVEQVELGIEYVLNKIGQGEKMVNIGGYMNNMVRTPSLLESKQQQIQELVKKQQDKTVALHKKQQQEFFENRKNEIQNNFIQAKAQFITDIFQQNEALATELINNLQTENQVSNPRLLAELAWAKFQELSLAGNPQQQLLNAINQAGFSFNSYVSEWVEQKFVLQIQEIKNYYQRQADDLGIKLV
jgi:plasmid replication initiation protein